MPYAVNTSHKRANMKPCVYACGVLYSSVCVSYSGIVYSGELHMSVYSGERGSRTTHWPTPASSCYNPWSEQGLSLSSKFFSSTDFRLREGSVTEKPQCNNLTVHVYIICTDVHIWLLHPLSSITCGHFQARGSTVGQQPALTTCDLVEVVNAYVNYAAKHRFRCRVSWGYHSAYCTPHLNRFSPE